MIERQALVLWVDDEPDEMSSFVDLLREHSEVRFVSNAEEAIRLCRAHEIVPDLVIWDMMMPPGNLPLDQTEEGLRTGQVFFGEMRGAFPRVPALLFTNIENVDVHRRYHCPEDLSWAFRKRDLLPRQLTAKVKEILDGLAGAGPDAQ